MLYLLGFTIDNGASHTKYNAILYGDTLYEAEDNLINYMNDIIDNDSEIVNVQMINCFSEKDINNYIYNSYTNTYEKILNNKYKRIVSDKVFSAQEYLELLTGKCYMYPNDKNDEEFINDILYSNNIGHMLRYDLTDINIVSNSLEHFVLVELSNYDESDNKKYKYFEINHTALNKLYPIKKKEEVI